jgi:hypothetical protein
LDYSNISNKTILIAPLDWGMGHTARCVPIITTLILNNCKVTIACNAAQALYYKQELNPNSNLYFVALNGYNIFYWNSLFTLSIVMQLPKICFKIIIEYYWLKNHLNKTNYDFIISDNRYGFRNKAATSILITHQLQLLVPYFKTIINALLASFINKFDACWIPDNAHENERLSGVLSHNKRVVLPIHYIGLLTRFSSEQGINQANNNNVLVLLTGPVTARKHLQNLIIKKYCNTQFSVTLVNSTHVTTKQNITQLGVLNSTQLLALIHTNATIITRSGYTSIMDFYSLNICVKLIATQHQPEQEYLLNYVCNKYPTHFTRF